MNKDAFIRKTGVITDAFEVFLAVGGNVAVWILFLCMIANILDAAVHFSQAISLAIMLLQAVTLDIACFGLKTTAKNLLKVPDSDIQKAAQGGLVLSRWLLGVMIITVVLVTAKTIAPTIATFFLKNPDPIVKTIQNWIDVIDELLILVRLGFTVIYQHTVMDLREIETGLKEQEEKQVQVNDQQLLAVIDTVQQLSADVQNLSTQASGNVQQADSGVQNRIHHLENVHQQLSGNVQNLAQRVDKIIDMYTALSTAIQTDVHNPVDMDMYINRLDKLENMFRTLHVSVTAVNNNVLNLTQNNTYTQPQIVDMPVYDAEATNEGGDKVEAITEGRTEAMHPDMSLVPVLEVPGFSAKKVQMIIAAYLAGTQWHKMRGNYSRDIKPVRDAYESYLATMQSGAHA